MTSAADMCRDDVAASLPLTGLFHRRRMRDALPWLPLDDVACRVAAPEHASRLTSCSKPHGQNLSKSITEAVTDLLNVALTVTSLRQKWFNPQEWWN